MLLPWSSGWCLSGPSITFTEATLIFMAFVCREPFTCVTPPDHVTSQRSMSPAGACARGRVEELGGGLRTRVPCAGLGWQWLTAAELLEKNGVFSVSQSKFLVFGCPICPSASIDGIVCALHVVICIQEQRFPSLIKPPVFLEQHGNPRAAFLSVPMISSRGIPGVQSPSGAPLPAFIRLWKMDHPAG